MRSIDHLVLPVTTLNLARARLTGLGFTVAPDAQHPFGTGNCCVFFQNRTYLEPITILDRLAADLAAAEGTFFVRRIKRYTERQGDGFAMLAFRSDSAERDLAAFEQAGLAAGPVFRFTRNAVLPDGCEREIGVALAYADHPAAPDATFFACQHLAPEALFEPAYLKHRNGAVGVTGVTAVAEEPEMFRSLLRAASGEEPRTTPGGGIETANGDCSVVVVPPTGFLDRYGIEAPQPRRGFLLAGFDIRVSDLEAAAGHAGPAAFRHGARLVVPPAPGLSAVLVFTPAEHD
jgi:hypothetical protein